MTIHQHRSYYPNMSSVGRRHKPDRRPPRIKGPGRWSSWSDEDPRWTEPARELARALLPGERLEPTEFFASIRQRLGWGAPKATMILAAAEGRGLLVFDRNAGRWHATEAARQLAQPIADAG